MKKMFLIGWKDVRLALRDSTALVLMLAAPFLLTLGMGAITGRFSGSSNVGISDVPVVLVNQDEGELGQALVSPDQFLLVFEVASVLLLVALVGAVIIAREK